MVLTAMYLGLTVEHKGSEAKGSGNCSWTQLKTATAPRMLAPVLIRAPSKASPIAGTVCQASMYIGAVLGAPNIQRSFTTAPASRY